MKKTSTRNETFKILFFCALLFFAYTSAAGQEKISSDSDLAEFDLGVRELETNYVGFPTSVTEQTRDQYEALKPVAASKWPSRGGNPGKPWANFMPGSAISTYGQAAIHNPTCGKYPRMKR